MLRRQLTCLLCIFCLAVTAGSSLAQEAQEQPEEQIQEDQSSTTPRGETLPPAYGEQMARLAEILGALHYLRALCGANEGQLWREQMEIMLATEDPSEERRAQLVARFNRGFRGYREIYRECTPAAAEAANSFMRQGIRLAAEIPSRYGN